MTERELWPETSVFDPSARKLLAEDVRPILDALRQRLLADLRVVPLHELGQAERTHVRQVEVAHAPARELFHPFPGAQHEVLNEINKDEVLDDVVRFLRRALGLMAVS